MRMWTRFSELARLGVLGVVAVPLLTLGANCTPKPRILSPANETQIDAAGTPVSIDLVGRAGPRRDRVGAALPRHRRRRR